MPLDFLSMLKRVRGARCMNIHAKRTPDMRETNARHTQSTRPVYAQRASNTLCIRCQIASFAQILKKVGLTTFYDFQCTGRALSVCDQAITLKKSWKNSQTTKIFMLFFEGVTVRHPLTVMLPTNFLNFPNHFSMKLRHKTGFKKKINS